MEGNKRKSDSQTKRVPMAKRILRMTSHNGRDGLTIVP